MRLQHQATSGSRHPGGTPCASMYKLPIQYLLQLEEKPFGFREREYEGKGWGKKWEESSNIQILAAPSMNRNVCEFMLPICHDADKGPQRACMNSSSLHGELSLGPAFVSADGSCFSSWPEEEGFLPDSLSELPSVCCSPLSWSCDPVGAVGFFPPRLEQETGCYHKNSSPHACLSSSCWETCPFWARMGWDFLPLVGRACLDLLDCWKDWRLADH